MLARSAQLVVHHRLARMLEIDHLKTPLGTVCCPCIPPRRTAFKRVKSPVGHAELAGKPKWGKCVGGHVRNRTGIHGFAIRCVTTPPRGLNDAGSYSTPSVSARFRNRRTALAGVRVLWWFPAMTAPAKGPSRGLDPQPILAGLLAALVGYASTFALVLAGLAAVGASPAEAASGLLALCLALGAAQYYCRLAQQDAAELCLVDAGRRVPADPGSRSRAGSRRRPALHHGSPRWSCWPASGRRSPVQFQQFRPASPTPCWPAFSSPCASRPSRPSRRSRPWRCRSFSPGRLAWSFFAATPCRWPCLSPLLCWR